MAGPPSGVEQGDVRVPVGVVVGKGSPAARIGSREGPTERCGDIPETTAQIAQQLRGLPVGYQGVVLLDVVVHVSVGDEEIEPAVVVIIEETGSEPEVVQAHLPEPGGEGNLGVVRPVVTVQGVVLQLVVGDEEIEVAVVVVIPGVDAHARLRLAVGAQRRSREQADLVEAASLVAVQKIGGHVVGDVDVGVTVAVEIPADGSEDVAGIIHSRRRAAVREAAGAVADEIPIPRR